jgi:hypothetical protein
MAKLGKELFKKMQAIQGHAYLSDAIEEMPDDRILELVPIILEWQEEGAKVLREFLKAHLTPRAADGLESCPHCHYILNFDTCPKCGAFVERRR